MSDALSCTNDGCQATFDAEPELMTHGERCPYQQDFCSQCFATVRRRDMVNHITVECPNRISICDTRQKEVQVCELDVHLGQCPKREVPCPHCKSHVLFEVLGTHLDTCSSLKECCYKEVGCEFRGTCQTLPEHEKDVSCHLSLHFDRLKDVTTTTRKLTSENSELIAGHNRLNRKVNEVSEKCEQFCSTLQDFTSNFDTLKQFASDTKGSFEKLIELLKWEAKEIKIQMEEMKAIKTHSVEEKVLKEPPGKGEKSSQSYVLAPYVPLNYSNLLITGIISSELEKGSLYRAQVQWTLVSIAQYGEKQDIGFIVELLPGMKYNCYVSQEQNDGVLTHYFGIVKPNNLRWPPVNRVIFCILDPYDEEGNKVLFYKILLFKDRRPVSRSKEGRIRFYNDGIPAVARPDFEGVLLCFESYF